MVSCRDSGISSNIDGCLGNLHLDWTYLTPYMSTETSGRVRGQGPHNPQILTLPITALLSILIYMQCRFVYTCIKHTM